MIMLMLAIKFFQEALHLKYESSLELLYLALGIVLIAGSIYLTHPHKHDKKHNEAVQGGEPPGAPRDAPRDAPLRPVQPGSREGLQTPGQGEEQRQEQ
jgi:hypothetical protein